MDADGAEIELSIEGVTRGDGYGECREIHRIEHAGEEIRRLSELRSCAGTTAIRIDGNRPVNTV